MPPPDVVPLPHRPPRLLGVVGDVSFSSSSLQMGEGWGVVTWPLAPDPPCEQGLAVVGGGCWAAVSSSLSPRA
jgi:hypothetical protein